ncbi:DinB family protein [Kineococcus endophyticus]|uniref:DinB family protein n=1 Tax=Kineococcus endophyticus TaxID=1181883 RepID=A0ABV3P4Z1_9ACTN
MPFAGEPSPLSSDPTALCAGYLDWYATVLLRRLEGLSDVQVRTPAVPSGWSLLGLVQHSACVRRFWVRHVFSGEDVDFSWPGTAEQEWVPRPEDTVAGVSAFYRGEHENSLRVLRSHDAATTATRAYGGTGTRPTLAWIAFHLLQESARHAGHADVARELLDGATELDP